MTMNMIRIFLNGIFTFLCFLGSVYLLERGVFLLRDRWHPETGIYFVGVPLYLLAFGLIFLGLFSLAVMQAWVRGVIPMPKPGTFRPHPAYKGQIIVRYWYFVMPAMMLLISSLLLAKPVSILSY